jgi:hypothetical protein
MNHATQFGKIKMKKIKTYIRYMLSEMNRADDVYQIKDAIHSLMALATQNKSVSSKTICHAINLVEELEKDLDNVTKEKH